MTKSEKDQEMNTNPLSGQGNKGPLPRTDNNPHPSFSGSSKEDWIGNQLKRVYDQALEDEIPNDMLALLDQLDSNAPKSGEGE